MHEGYSISKVALTAVVLWLIVVVLFAGAWATFLANPDRPPRVPIMLAVTACGFAVFTGTLHNRIYVERITRLIRVANKMEDGDGHDGDGHGLRSVRDDPSARRR